MIDKYTQEMKDRFLAIERKAKMEMLKRELELWEGVGKRENSEFSWDSIREQASGTSGDSEGSW